MDFGVCVPDLHASVTQIREENIAHLKYSTITIFVFLFMCLCLISTRNIVDLQMQSYTIYSINNQTALCSLKAVIPSDYVICILPTLFEKIIPKQKLCNDMKWREMRSKVIFGHPKWPPAPIL